MVGGCLPRMYQKYIKCRVKCPRNFFICRHGEVALCCNTQSLGSRREYVYFIRYSFFLILKGDMCTEYSSTRCPLNCKQGKNEKLSITAAQLCARGRRVTLIKSSFPFLNIYIIARQFLRHLRLPFSNGNRYWLT